MGLSMQDKTYYCIKYQDHYFHLGFSSWLTDPRQATHWSGLGTVLNCLTDFGVVKLTQSLNRYFEVSTDIPSGICDIVKITETLTEEHPLGSHKTGGNYG
jgi:hypothetical protein